MACNCNKCTCKFNHIRVHMDRQMQKYRLLKLESSKPDFYEFMIDYYDRLSRKTLDLESTLIIYLSCSHTELLAYRTNDSTRMYINRAIKDTQYYLDFLRANNKFCEFSKYTKDDF